MYNWKKIFQKKTKNSFALNPNTRVPEQLAENIVTNQNTVGMGKVQT